MVNFRPPTSRVSEPGMLALCTASASEFCPFSTYAISFINLYSPLVSIKRNRANSKPYTHIYEYTYEGVCIREYVSVGLYMRDI